MINLGNNTVLKWLTLILLATNLSMGATFLYHKQQEKKQIRQLEEITIELPAQQRTRFFRDQLNLELDQVEVFRELNREFNRSAGKISHQLEILRMDMISELGKQKSNEKKLESITGDIGALHKELKQITIDYYLKMKAQCNEEQQVKLNNIFMSVLNKNEDVKLPEGGYGFGRNRRNLNHNNE